jgi:cytosine/adenosine deaminase-related metal-dependent hydrolase
MKTYQLTLNDESAALVEKMLQDGPWESIDELFMNGIGTLQEDVMLEDEVGLNYEEVRRRVHESMAQPDHVPELSEEELLAVLRDASLSEPK